MALNFLSLDFCYHFIIFFPTYFYFQFFPAYAKHIQAKLNVVENTIEPELTAIEKFHLPNVGTIEQQLEKLENLMDIWKIQPKLNVVEKTIEPELTAIEKFHLPIPQWKIQPKLNDVEKLKAEEKLKALREDWLKLIKIKKAYTAAEKR